MISEQYVWLVWSSSFLFPWIALFAAFPQYRRMMIWASAFTTPFGLTEPLFVPEYWNPPSLFDLAQRTGFDIESLIFCFGIGGVGAVLYNVFTGHRVAIVPASERHDARHRYHVLALATPFALFPPLYFLPWNPIYPGIIAMVLGAIAHIGCRPDLKWKVTAGGILFFAYYGVFLTGMHVTAPPDYIERVWRTEALTGVSILWMPLEELLFAIGFGMYWSGVYEHFTWSQCVRERAG